MDHTPASREGTNAVDRHPTADQTGALAGPDAAGTRVRATTASALAVLVLAVGCAAVTGSLSFTAALAAAVCGPTLADAGYERDLATWHNVTREVTVAGQTRTVALDSHLTASVRPDGDDRSTNSGTPHGGFAVLVTPRASSLDQPLNPVRTRSPVELVSALAGGLDAYGTLSDRRRTGTEQVTVLGTDTTLTRFAATGTGGDGEPVNVSVAVARVVHAGDHVVVGTVHRRGDDAERARLDRLVGCLEHPAGGDGDAGTPTTAGGTSTADGGPPTTTGGTPTASGTASFAVAANVVTVERGDVAAVPVSLTGTDTATLSLGSRALGYVVRAGLTDVDRDGQVTVRLDTHAAGHSPASQVVSATGSDRAAATRLTGSFRSGHRLAAEAYPMNLSVGGTETAVGMLSVQGNTSAG
ncbi:MAG: DUF6517 family protein [Halobacteriaceae archaeon]